MEIFLHWFLIGYGSACLTKYFYSAFMKRDESIIEHELTHGLLFLILASVI